MATLKDSMLKVHYALGHDPVSSSLYVSDLMIAEWFGEAIKILSESANLVECIGAIRVSVAGGASYSFDKATPINNDAIYVPWAQDTVKALGDFVRPTLTALQTATKNGCVYECTARSGDYKTSATTEPDWSTADAEGETVVDDAVTWTAREVKVCDVLSVIPCLSNADSASDYVPLEDETKALIRLRPGKKLHAYGSTISNELLWWYYANRSIVIEPSPPAATYTSAKWLSVFYFGVAPTLSYTASPERNPSMEVIRNCPEMVLVEYALYRAKMRYCAYNEAMFHYQMFQNYANQIKAESVARCLGKLTDVEEV